MNQESMPRAAVRHFIRVVATVAMIAALAPLPGRAETDSETRAQDREFLAARDAFRKGNAAALERYAAALKGYALEPYVEAYRLHMRLAEASPETMQAFFANNASTVVAEQLRSDWLRALVRRQQWEAFLAEYPKVAEEEPDLACYALQARWRLGDISAFDELYPVWTAPRILPDGCVPVAEALLASGRYGPEQVWERLRILLQAGQITAAVRTARMLPRSEEPSNATLWSIHRAPLRYLEHASLDTGKRLSRELMIFAVTRYAQTDAPAAVSLWEQKLKSQFSADERSYVWGQLATQGARQHDARALEWFTHADPTAIDDDQFAWWAREAMREEQWPAVQAAIARMSPRGRSQPVWIYWQARALRALDRRAEADALFARIAGEHSFYGKLATEELGRKIELPPRGYVPAPEDIDAMEQNAGLARALALFRLNLRTEAVREWNWAIRDMDDHQLLAAAEVARRAEIWDRAIHTAERTSGLHDFSLRFLAPYREIFHDRSNELQLDESWVLGIVRQESRFIPQARSAAGARGLMQVMPSTARWIAKRVGMRNFSLAHVSDVAVNIALGTNYLRVVLDGLDGSPVLAAAAYNAGPRRAQQWRATHPMEAAIYIESIPVHETRDYVKKVMSNTMYYAALLSGDTQPLKERLGIIGPRGTGDRTLALDGRPVSPLLVAAHHGTSTSIAAVSLDEIP